MSIINRMLQELEERREDATQMRLPGLVRAVPARGAYVVKQLPWRQILGLSLLLLIALLSWRLSVQWLGARPQVATQISADSAPPQVPVLRSASMVPSLPPLARARPVETEPKTRVGIDTEVPSAAPPVETTRLSKIEKTRATYASGPNDAGPNVLALAPPKSPIEKLPAAHNASLSSKGKSEPLLAAFDTPGQNASRDQPAVQKMAAGAETTAPMKQVSKEQNADYRYREALALINQGRMQEGQALLEEALRIDPKNLAAREVLLGVYLESKRYAEAEQLLQEALQLRLAPAVNAPALARIQVERGEQALALSTLETYLPVATESAAYHGFYAALLQRAGRHSEAITEFQFALKRQANQANWWLGLGLSLQHEKRNTEAEQAYLRARAGNTLSPELLAFVDQRLKQLQAAH